MPRKTTVSPPPQNRPLRPTRLEDVIGCLKYRGKAKTIEEMDRGIAEAVKKRYAHSQMEGPR